MRKAKEQAEREWMEKEGTVLGDEKIRKELEAKLKLGGRASWGLWRVPKWEALIDMIVGSVVE